MRNNAYEALSFIILLVFLYAGRNELSHIVNVPEHPGKHTYCPGCQQIVIRRVGLDVKVVGLEDGRCKQCKHKIAGVWS